MLTSKQQDSFVPPLWILTIISLACLLWFIVQLKELVVLLVVGYFIAYAVDPVLVWFESRKISRTVGIFVVFGLLLAAFLFLMFTAIPTVVSEFGKLSENLNHYIQIGKDKSGPIIDQIQNLIPKEVLQGKDIGALISSTTSISSYFSGDTVKGVFSAIFGTLLRGYSITLTLVNIALLPFIVYYLAIDLPRIHQFFLAIPPVTKRGRLVKIFSEIDQYVSSFVRGQVIVCTILFLLYAIGLGFVGVDLWLLLAAISGFGNIIPYVGFVIGILLSSLMALVTFGDLSHLLWVWGVYGVVQILEGTLITPKVIGESVGLSPLVVILALFAGGQLMGLLGVFLAVPAAAVIRVLAKYSHEWVLNRQ